MKHPGYYKKQPIYEADQRKKLLPNNLRIGILGDIRPLHKRSQEPGNIHRQSSVVSSLRSQQSAKRQAQSEKDSKRLTLSIGEKVQNLISIRLPFSFS
jgi:hypothetical protein